jgi:hypothetical protein
MSLNDFITLHLDLINLKNNKKKSKECLNKDCNIQAVFNYKNYLSINHITCRKNIYCSKHKLKEEIEKNINKIPNNNITIIKLFYDGY